MSRYPWSRGVQRMLLLVLAGLRSINAHTATLVVSAVTLDTTLGAS